jgi:hypothetical protein
MAMTTAKPFIKTNPDEALKLAMKAQRLVDDARNMLKRGKGDTGLVLARLDESSEALSKIVGNG